MSLRSRSRELTLQLLFEKEFQLQGETPNPSKELIQHAQSLVNPLTNELNPKDIAAYALILFNGIMQNLNAIDQLITKYSENWKITRMPLVDRNILRIATFELQFMNHEVPVASAIDEAVELAKKFSTTDSKSFVNGVLDQIGRHQNKIEVDEGTIDRQIKSS